MLEVLDSPEVRKHVAHVSIDRYHRMIDLGVFDEWPVELLNGVLVEKMPKSELHIFLVQFLYRALNQFCPDTKWLVAKEDPITIGNSEPEPDIAVISGTLSDFRHTKPTTAELVIEVAISSLALDRAKAPEYASAGISEYWIIRPEDEVTEVYRRPSNGAYLEKIEVSASETLESSSFPGFRFHMGEVLV